ncbi:MAG: TlpA family protein disulfide reductase [Deltaproteobacteria bacterium]|nr:TlpA family protein disulfide reductase [Deltaproteobacteria bacterium]MDQ3300791.1 TlpA family protein disulfide reductase [Myxococcota bacterium]
MLRGLAVVAFAILGCSSPPVAREPVVVAPTSPLARVDASVDLDGRPIGTSAAPTILIVMASWCSHCHVQLAVLAEVREAYPATRILGINYKEHEEYDGRGNPQALRAYVAKTASWLRVIPADDALFEVLGRPPKIPTVFVYDASGRLVARFDRRDRAPPDATELAALLRGLGA